MASEKHRMPSLQEPQAIVKVFVSSSTAPEEENRIIKQEPNTNDHRNEQYHEARISLPFFNIHKDFICFYSPFFVSAFDGPYEEGQTQCMTLYDTDVEIFGIFNHWIYQQKLPPLTGRSEQLHLLHLSKLWVLGQRVSVSSLQNKAMNRIFSLICEGSTHKFNEFTALAYDISGGDNELAKVAACAVACGKPSFFELFCEGGFPATMSMEVMKALRAQQNNLPERAKMNMGQPERFYVEG